MQALEGLNERQQEAAVHFEGPELILAGAGSGKTRVLTNRIAWLISEKHIAPWNILAITFTNKAAGEMRDRVDRIVGQGADAVWVATFHSTCARILRRYIDCIGYQTNFTIYDADDSKSLMKSICKNLNLDTKVLKEKMILSVISSAKDELIGPEEFPEWYESDYISDRIALAYTEYQKELKKNNALDFDDLIFKTVELFRKREDVLEQYRRRFRFIMVDEYQDTNTAQFQLISILAGSNGNLCVVGDDDQSIYRFRGANIRNILSFENIYPGSKVVKLEQNYRSTQNILDAANAVIANNRGRKEKKLWTSNPKGDPVVLAEFPSAFEEAEYVTSQIGRKVGTDGYNCSDFAVLYRTNAQSRLLEEKLLLSGIPYRIVGGINFYARKEIKDLLSYLKTVDNGVDDLAVTRIINVPRRGIGEASIRRVQAYADVNGLSFFDALTRAREIPGMGRSAAKIEGFVTFIQVLRSKAKILGVKDLLTEIIEKTGYEEELRLEGTDEAKERILNINELISKAAAYEESTKEPSLSDFLQEVSLVADIDMVDPEKGQVLLMTLHSAKGLEFPVVYLTGMEEGLFPSFMSITGEDYQEGLEEERRLCYVGITRAMRELTLTCARSRMIRGQTQYNQPSRFIEEIPEEMLQRRNAGYGKVYGERPFRTGGYTDDGSFSGTAFGNTGAAEEKRRKAAPKSQDKIFNPAAYKAVKPDRLDFTEGDRVSHVKFGEGTVITIEETPKDYAVTVDFDRCGVKKMFAAFARLKRI